MGFFWGIFFVLGFCFNFEVLNSQNVTCNSNDLRALESILNNLDTQIDGWGANSSSNCCEWSGVTCSSGRVVKLELGNRRLVGRLSSSIGSLGQLQVLNFSRNSLWGSLPVSLFHLPSLEVIDVSQNSLNGSLPADICEKLGGIHVLNLAENHFYGGLPPGLENCSSLEQLSLGMNGFTGVISEGIFRLRRLTLLNLQENELSGTLSNAIGNLKYLARLEISSNRFTGNIPDVFYGFEKLQYFEVHSNKFTGGIPPSLSNSTSLRVLNLNNNSFGGLIDLDCSAMKSLTTLDLGSNGFYGPMPENLASCPNLENINLSKNKLSSQIPESFKNSQSLSFLSLSNASISNISSALEILQHCKNLKTLVLTLNFREEALPTDPTLHFPNLKVLIIANCRLTGSMPLWLSGSTKLQLLDLSWNCLSGKLPLWIGHFEFLFYLDLSNNSFSGEIPKSITGLQSLSNRNITLEEPSPDFPFFLKKDVNAKGLQYNQVWRFPPTVDLSHNNLSGSIWPEFGNLKTLHILDLKFNHMFGQIPASLSGMTSLETLDLSHNNLSGGIPSSFGNLSFLSIFSVAYNQLYGPIPSKGQFLTFPNTSFEGNQLCGNHAYPCSSSDGVPTEATNGSRRKTGRAIGMTVGIASGASFLVLMFMILLHANNSRRQVDPEKEDPRNKNDGGSEEPESSLIVLFQEKESNKILCLDDILMSTNNFDQANIIGCGGFGLVYKAILPDGRKVAIKRLSGDCGQMEREFCAEVEALSRAQHPNLVHLLGYCMFKTDRLLIYSYMENSSLDYWLHEKVDGPSPLDWHKRLQIAQGAARGLAYLHQSCEPHILHRDIKSSNILLDEKFEAHLADFGLARLILPYDTHVTTDLVGTLGYIPPEYSQASVATYKGDVYSFGVVLLELLTGKRPVDMCKPKGFRDLISWVFQMMKENQKSKVFDPFIYDEKYEKGMLQVLEIASLCLSHCPKVRPSTQHLVSWLDSIDLNL